MRMKLEIRVQEIVDRVKDSLMVERRAVRFIQMEHRKAASGEDLARIVIDEMSARQRVMVYTRA